ncbi:MAG TPA: alpha/beta hydrolase-fold protein, partial [Terriglobales bacterium]|nr:alpha/beta hydrolase-fold protein [Terriglobales bacterium]
MRRWLVIVAALGSLVACGDDDDWKDRRVPSATPPLSIGAAQQRPAAVVLPEDYDITKQYPLVILLHGFGVSGSIQDFLLQLSARTTSHQFILVLPDGTRNSADQRFWDATPECCNFTGAPVDDVGYLAALIEEASEIYAVDRSRVRLTGHSNGGYMSYRYICEHPIRVDRIAVLAGSTFIDAADCDDPEPVDILHMHGTNDQTILYDRNLPPDADSGAV